MGADREMVLLTALAAVILIFVVLTWYAALFGLAIWMIAVGALRMMAKADPLMRRVIDENCELWITTPQVNGSAGNFAFASVCTLAHAPRQSSKT